MQTIIKLILFALTAPLIFCYDEMYDKIDIDKILNDDNLFNAYTDCLLDKGPCDVENSTKFKKLLPEIIETACAKCTSIQRDHVRKSVKALHFKKPEEYEEFKRKYDPKAEHQEKFKEFIFGSS